MQWVYFADTSEAVTLSDYRRNEDELGKRKVAYVLDDVTGEMTAGKPKATTRVSAEKDTAATNSKRAESDAG